MVDRIGSGGNLAREAILAAMKTQASQASEGRGSRDLVTGSADEATKSSDFASALGQSIEKIDDQVSAVDEIPKRVRWLRSRILLQQKRRHRSR